MAHTFCVEKILEEADSEVTLATPSVGNAVTVKRAHAVILTQPLNGFYIGSQDGTVKVIIVSSNNAGHVFDIVLEVGIILPINQKLVIKPTSPGPRVHVVVEGETK